MKSAKKSMAKGMGSSPGWFRIWGLLSAIWVADILGYSFYTTPPPPQTGSFDFYLGHYLARFIAVSLIALILPLFALAIRWAVLKSVLWLKGGSQDT